MLGILYVQNGHNACIAQIKTFLFHALKQESTYFIILDSLLILFAAMDTKYNDCHRVDNRYTTAIGMSVWRFFNIGKYKNQKVKDVCYFNPFYVAWCLESWQGFSLTSYERQLEKDPEDQELILKVRKCKTIV